MLKYYNIPEIDNVVGVDEAGRGCLAGPVVAGAVILGKNNPIEGLNDSKKIKPKTRRELAEIIRQEAVAYGIGVATPQEIDTLNILQATFLAMHRAIDQIRQTTTPALLLIDGNRFKPYFQIPHKTVIGGDGIYLSIAAASIIAKVYRDDMMMQLHEEHPFYYWNKNMGYPTAQHKTSIAKYGPTPHHRLSFKWKQKKADQ